MCTDINFRAADLIKLLEWNIYQMEFKQKKKIVPKVHPQITNLREFIETFAY